LRVLRHAIVRGAIDVTFEVFRGELAVLEAHLPGADAGFALDNRDFHVRIAEGERRIDRTNDRDRFGLRFAQRAPAAFDGILVHAKPPRTKNWAHEPLYEAFEPDLTLPENIT